MGERSIGLFQRSHKVGHTLVSHLIHMARFQNEVRESPIGRGVGADLVWGCGIWEERFKDCLSVSDT